MILNIANTILASISLLFSLYVFAKNKLYSKTNVDVSILNTITAAHSEVAKALQDLAIFQNDPSDFGETMRQNAYSSFDTLLLAYNYACSKYYKQAVTLDWFELTYKPRISSLFKTPLYQELLANKESYPYLHRFHSEYCTKSQNH